MLWLLIFFLLLSDFNHISLTMSYALARAAPGLESSKCRSSGWVDVNGWCIAMYLMSHVQRRRLRTLCLFFFTHKVRRIIWKRHVSLQEDKEEKRYRHTCQYAHTLCFTCATVAY